MHQLCIPEGRKLAMFLIKLQSFKISSVAKTTSGGYGLANLGVANFRPSGFFLKTAYV